jgi:uncharacterized protein YfaS (alpha-2-macroglobulin family)
MIIAPNLQISLPILLLLTIAKIPFAVPYQYEPADRSQLNTLKRDQIQILPSIYLRDFDPITIFLDNEISGQVPGPVDNQDTYCTLDPAHPGEYRSIDSRTIEFRPTIPWQPLKTYKIQAGRINKTLITMLTPPTQIIPSSGTRDLDPITKIGLQFSQRVDTKILTKLITFETCLLPGIDRKGCKTLSGGDYKIKVSEESSNSFTYWFIFNSPIGYGLKLNTILRLADIADLADAERIYTFDTRAEFTIDNAGTYIQTFSMSASGINYNARQAIRLNNDGKLIVNFTSPPAEINLTTIKNLLSFSPSLTKIDWHVDGNRLIITPTITPDKLYRMSIQPIEMKDKAGRTLLMKKSCSFYFYQPQENALIKWQRGFGILERFGPKHFPIHLKGIRNIDLRIYKIDALHNAFWPYPRIPVVVNEKELPPGPGEEPVSDTAIRSTLSSYEIISHIKMLGSPQYSSVIDCEKNNISKFQSIDLKPALSSINGDKPGTFLVGYRKLDGSDERSYIRIQVTDLCVSTVESKNGVLFGVSSYASGKMISGAKVTVEGIRDNSIVNLIRGTTDNNGFFNAKINYDPAYAAIRKIIIEKDDDILVLDTRGPAAPLSFVNNHWSAGPDWLQWINNQPYNHENDRRLRTYIRTERPLYRPEDTVLIKGYIRETFQGKILFPRNNSFTLRIVSPAGTQYDYSVKLSSLGSFDMRFREDNLPTGDYRVLLLQNHQKNMSEEVGSTEFSIEAYRLPRFEVKLNGPEKAPNDRPVTIDLTASYYAGGRVSGQNADWKVTSYPFSYQPGNVTGYILSSDNRYGAFDDERSQGVLEESNTTDDNGHTKITVNPQTATNGNPRKYIIEATVTDADQQSVSNYHSMITLPPFVLGMKVERYITRGSKIKADLIALDVNGAFSTGQKISVQLKKMSWISYLAETDFSKGKPKYITNETTDLIEEKTVITKKEPVEIEFSNQTSGVFIIELSSRDRLGRLQTLKTDLFLAGDNPVTWKKADNYVFETSTDKKEYIAGQTAHILLKSPYQRGLAIAITESPDGSLRYETIPVSNGQATFDLAITPDMTPRIPVSFLLMRPRIDDIKRTPDGVEVDPGKPETIGNTTWIKVKPAAYAVSVDLTHRKTVRPGSDLDVTINLKDFNGNPVAGEVALWLVDEAVLSLKKEKPLAPLSPFIEEVQSHISMRDSRNMALGNLQIPEAPGGDGDGGMGDQFGKITVRKNFKTVPYWNPSIIIDKSGQATVKIKLSDDLTNFAMRALAISGSDKFGAGTSKVEVRIPVLVQPALPRFVRIGDKIKAGAIARVVEGAGGSGLFTIKAEGLSMENNQRIQSCELSPTKAVQLYAAMNVQTPQFDMNGNMKQDSVVFKISVIRQSDSAGDAFEVKLPLLLDRQFIEEVKSGTLTNSTQFNWNKIAQPARENTLQRGMVVSSQLFILNSISGLNSLIRYPYGCTEQRISQSYPSLMYNEIWKKFGLQSPDPNIRSRINKTLAYLSRVQSSDGYFSYWPNSSPYVYLTAYVVEFLTEVKKANVNCKNCYAFDQTMYSNAINALKRSLRSDYANFIDGYSYYERTSALTALAKAGEVDIGYARELIAHTRQLNSQSKARLLNAILVKRDGLDSEIKDLEKALWAETVYKLDKGKEVFAGLQERNFSIGERVHSSEITTIACMISALSSVEKVSPKLDAIVNELLRLSDNGDWGNTQQNSLSLLALLSFINVAKTSNADFTIASPNGYSENFTLDKDRSIWTKYWDSNNDGSLTSKNSKETFYARVTSSYLPTTPGYMTDPQQNGFSVQREFFIIKKDKEPVKIAFEKGGKEIVLNQGDIIEEHIQVKNPTARFFTAITSPFAAGFEPLNPNLETSGSDAKTIHSTTSNGDYQSFLDDKVSYFFEQMPPGTFDFYFRLKATTEGEFTHPAATAEMMYNPKVTGASAGVKVVVKGKE